MESSTVHATSSGRESTTAPSEPGLVMVTLGGYASATCTGLDHAPQSGSRPLVRTRTETVAGDASAASGSW